jgi:excisionase family DNA binding protein
MRLVRSVERGAYTIAQVCERISMPRSTFFRLRDLGELPFLEEVKPRLGRLVRYRADLVEQYLVNRCNRDIA